MLPSCCGLLVAIFVWAVLGCAWMSTAVAQVNSPPTVSQFQFQIVPKGSASWVVPFTVGDAQTGPASVEVTATSSVQSVLPNSKVVPGGQGADRTITLQPAPDAEGSTTITVQAKDPAGLVTVRTFTVIIAARPRDHEPAGLRPRGGRGHGRVSRPGHAVGRGLPVVS